MGTVIKTNVIYGKNYEDSVTGFIGVCTAITKWRFGCVRISLQPKANNKEGKIEEAQWFDEESLVGIEPYDHSEEQTGGPTPNPKQNPDQ